MNPIKKFTIKKLFESIDIAIPFNSETKILIGENGVGKTQALNIFYFVLTKNFYRLSEFNFSEVILEFANGKSVEISKSEIEEVVKEVYSHPMVKDLIDEIGFSQFESFRKRFQSSKGSRRRIEMDIEFNAKLRKYSIHQLYRVFEQIEISKREKQSGLFSNTLPDQWEQIINDSVGDFEILYFPTYRRVEEDLQSLGYNDDDEALDQEQILIQFGMDDVQKRFNQIEVQIDKYLKDGFSQITSEILGQLVRGFSAVDRSFLNRISLFDIEIILARVGNKLSDSDKQSIRNIVENQEEKNPSLMYFLNKLVEIYEKQKTIDNSVKLFRDTCNKYLVNKEINYDESAIRIFVRSKGAKSNEILLSKLSSGEKQIISILSKVYLSDSKKRFLILFDEPELSLGIGWQKDLLPDVIKSERCDFLLAVTHSPFIFDNELDQYAIGLDEYITIAEDSKNELC